MALKVSIDTDLGVTATYLRVRDISANNDKKEISFSVYGYASKIARDTGKTALYVKSHEVTYEELGYTTKEDIFNLTYTYVKELEEYVGAIDLI